MTINKAKVDQWIPKARAAIADAKILNDNGKLDSGYRGQISAFGAAVSMGSVLSAVAFFSKKGSDKDHDSQRKENDYDRSKLIDAVRKIIGCSESLDKFAQTDKDAKEQILHAAIALKLAMNLYEWEPKGKGE